MSQTAFVSRELFTQDEFEEWLSELPQKDANRYELLNGSIVISPPVTWPYGNTEARMVREVGNCAVQHQLGEVFGSSTRYRLLSGDTLEPEVSFISDPRLQAGPSPRQGKFLEIAPNLVVEILSTTPAKRDRTKKKDIYERHGVSQYSLVDADQREVTVFCFTNGRDSSALTFCAGAMLTSIVLAPFTIICS
ncbi:MAG: Uma2 family endonuclease [Candidatus Binatia bacterium]